MAKPKTQAECHVYGRNPRLSFDVGWLCKMNRIPSEDYNLSYMCPF